MARLFHRAPIIVVAACLLGAQSATSGPAPTANITRGCVDRFDASADYFPDKLTIEDAANFTVDYRKSYKVVTLKEAYAGGPPERYVLVQCGAPTPALTGPLAGAQVIHVPIRSMFALSTTQVALLVDLERLDVLTGVSDLAFVDRPDVSARIAAGNVAEFAKAGLAIDVERVVTSRPDLLMTDGGPRPTLAVIRSAGVPVVADIEWRESTALGRAEWLKYMALFLNEERKTQSLYSGIKTRYRALKARTAALPDSARPLVMTGRSSRGTFIIAGGKSYVAALIADAGGRYAWSDNPGTGFASVDLESQLQRAANADVWINGGGWKNLAAMLEDEPRYAEFKAYQRGQIWVYERRQTPTRGNDYWSRSVTRPDIVLADLLKIFHPSLAPEHAFEWYMPVAAR